MSNLDKQVPKALKRTKAFAPRLPQCTLTPTGHTLRPNFSLRRVLDAAPEARPHVICAADVAPNPKLKLCRAAKEDRPRVKGSEDHPEVQHFPEENNDTRCPAQGRSHRHLNRKTRVMPGARAGLAHRFSRRTSPASSSWLDVHACTASDGEARCSLRRGEHFPNA